jgi:hypothetical protein
VCLSFQQIVNSGQYVIVFGINGPRYVSPARGLIMRTLIYIYHAYVIRILEELFTNMGYLPFVVPHFHTCEKFTFWDCICFLWEAIILVFDQITHAVMVRYKAHQVMRNG